MCKIYLSSLLMITLLTLDLTYGTARSEDNLDIRILAGEPNYKSVNLTWEVEARNSNDTESIENELPQTFTIFYCELQSFGPHRCRSKVVDNNELIQGEKTKQFSTQIDNLRMATKYSFHIKPQLKHKLQKISGRADSRDNEVEPESMFSGQTIVIPTKGFSAQATKCLPHASEIEVETGPYFGGKIVVDGGNCGIQGNPKDIRDKYVMRIDHNKCGSLVKPQTNTVETFITVQENLGIFTHSTRRFVVVCTFQSGIQTVRASFSIPGKGKASSVVIPEESERSGRERQFRMVDKSALILKEHDEPEVDEKVEEVKESQTVQPTTQVFEFEDTENAVAVREEIVPGVNEADIKSLDIPEENILKEAQPEPNQRVNFAKLIDETYTVNESTPRANSSSSSTGLVIATSLSVIMVGVFIYILQREYRRQKTINRLTKQRQIIKNP
ncbi:uncharacterized protein LOC119646633 [Hermetia illucens]|nr:uncharacterized protein LOC119646633 [Hermetia illucens]